jgi:hypothetical protein
MPNLVYQKKLTVHFVKHNLCVVFRGVPWRLPVHHLVSSFELVGETIFQLRPVRLKGRVPKIFGVMGRAPGFYCLQFFVHVVNGLVRFLGKILTLAPHSHKQVGLGCRVGVSLQGRVRGKVLLPAQRISVDFSHRRIRNPLVFAYGPDGRPKHV